MNGQRTPTRAGLAATLAAISERLNAKPDPVAPISLDRVEYDGGIDLDMTPAVVIPPPVVIKWGGK